MSWIAALLLGILATSCGVSAGASHPKAQTGPPGSDVAALSPSALAQARKAFHDQIVTDAAAFASDVDSLQSRVGGGDLAGARQAELAAQAAYDHFRLLEQDNSVNASTLDELASEVRPGQSFAGLHAVERDLWTSSGDASADASALAGQAPVAEYLLSRDELDPEAIGTTAVAELGWAADWAIPGREELYSHDDTVDIAATVSAADAAFASLAPLGTTVAPALTASVRSDFHTLSSEVATLGPPTQVVDSAIGTGEQRTLTQTVDATAATLSELAAKLVPYGTRQPAAYPS
jgi:iron uptake system EfeUOB component EfeO/EfeM